VKAFAACSTPSFIPASGRFYCYADLRWVTNSDDNYGITYYQHAESGLTGADPVYEWEHQGMQLPKGVHIKNLLFAGRTNNNQIADLEIVVVERSQINPNASESGWDNDNEMVNTVIYRDTWRNAVGTFTGAMNDRHRATIPINHTMSANSEISIYIKPQGTLTATRYFLASYTWELA